MTMSQPEIQRSAFDRDAELVRNYVQQGSQEAFAEIFRRHLGLVYGTCLRELHDADLASDASQAVFLLLARKARTLRSGMTLTAWLFQTARFVASNLRRSEQRRTHREQAVLDERSRVQMDHAGDPQQELWNRTEPVLNEALAALNARDRAAILLRYFEGCSLQETGAALSMSEDAARMRITRALEKMRRHLLKAGVALSLAALTSLLSQRAATSAEVPLSLLHLIDIPPGTAATSNLGGLLSHAIARGAARTMFLLKLKLAAMIGATGLVSLGGADLIRTAELSHRTIHVVPGAIPNLRLPDSFTLHFSEIRRSVETPETLAKVLKVIRDAIEADVKKGTMTREQADKQFAMQASVHEPMKGVERNNLIVSEHDDKLYYRGEILTPLGHTFINTWISDGVLILNHVNENQEVIGQAQNFFQSWVFPLPGLGFAAVPLLKADSQTGPIVAPTANGSETTLQGLAPWVGASNGKPGTFYTPADLRIRMVDGRPQALELRLKANGRVAERWTFSNHRLFAGAWIAGRIRHTRYAYGDPTEQTDYQLLDASTTPVDESQFAIDPWIHPDDLITYRGSDGSAQFKFDPKQGSWREQVSRHVHQ